MTTIAWREFCAQVMLALDTMEERITALLHDVVEDCGWSLDQLRAEGFSAAVVGAVDPVTRRPGEDYEAFVLRAAANPIGRRVKLADLRDNFGLTRIAQPTAQGHDRIGKYQRAIALIERVEEPTMGDKEKDQSSSGARLELSRRYRARTRPGAGATAACGSRGRRRSVPGVFRPGSPFRMHHGRGRYHHRIEPTRIGGVWLHEGASRRKAFLGMSLVEREQPWGKDMVLVALTGWGQHEDRRRSTEAGFDSHLVKPVDLDALMTLLTKRQPRSV